ncbi:HAD-IA family hydrolase [Propioniciclava tarda]|uniref:HAD family hydrolase n=1 Tax=Propioniciclava tarda TaxID=433330 RepID=A0A4Q9KKS0_PROTD|nr:HAD-IA family hydrolase [Propioniciclava tarda]TBT94239.1 HAD family hydrolase [Propioniciclava tarda]SMO75227.1 sugar-phosphatase [Propioniciclava tarda]
MTRDRLDHVDVGVLDAVLFDMDGTLLDSYPVVERCWTEVAVRHGLDPASVLAMIHGVPADYSLRRLFPEASAEFIAAEFDRLLDRECEVTDGVRALPGAHELIAWLDERRTPWAVVTSAVPRLAWVRLRAAGFEPTVLVTPLDTARGKPAPDPFLEGARRLGVPIERCLAVEDSPGGLESARASGAVVVEVGPDGVSLVDLLGRLR